MEQNNYKTKNTHILIFVYLVANSTLNFSFLVVFFLLNHGAASLFSIFGNVSCCFCDVKLRDIEK